MVAIWLRLTLHLNCFGKLQCQTNLEIVAGSAFRAQHMFGLDSAGGCCQLGCQGRAVETPLPAAVGKVPTVGILTRAIFSKGHPSVPCTSSVASTPNAVQLTCLVHSNGKTLFMAAYIMKMAQTPSASPLSAGYFHHGRQWPHQPHQLPFLPQAANMPTLVTTVPSSPVTIFSSIDR